LDQNAIVRRTIFVFSDEKGLQAWRGMGVDGEQGLQRAAVLMQGDVADDGESPGVAPGVVFICGGSAALQREIGRLLAKLERGCARGGLMR
jgi:hypothetical protein